MRVMLSAGLAALALAAGCTRRAAPDSGRTAVRLQTDWYAQPEHGGFYQAQAAGLYARAGLDVTILEGAPSNPPPQVVAAGHAEFGIGRSDDIIIAASRGIPLVMLAAFMQKDPQGILYHQGQGIHSFADLNGRNLMAIPGSNFLRILEHDGIHVRVTPSDFGISRFLASPAMVAQCFVTNEPYYARKAGAAVGVLLLSDEGFSPYRVFYTRRDYLESHPHVVAAFTKASLAGWREYVSGDNRAANARIRELNPRMTPDFEAYCLAAMKKYHLIEGDAAAGDAPGRINPARIAQQIRQLQAIGVLSRPVTVAEVLP